MIDAPHPRILYAPTASGKSAIALDWSKQYSGTIVNSDSLQVYNCLPILTAQPSEIELKTVPHRLYGFQSADQPMTAVRWAQLAAQETRNLSHPLLVGGTGMYVTTLLDGIAPIPTVPAEIREQMEAFYKEHGPEAALARLAKVDPASAANIHPHHRQRLVRALEIYEATGESLSTWHTKPKTMFLAPDVQPRLVVFLPPKPWIVERAETRLDQMLAAGVREEVQAFVHTYGTNAPASQALGFRELWAHIQGKLSLEEARTITLRDTADYIKRQLTWGRMQLAKRAEAIVVSTAEEAIEALR